MRGPVKAADPEVDKKQLHSMDINWISIVYNSEDTFFSMESKQFLIQLNCVRSMEVFHLPPHRPKKWGMRASSFFWRPSPPHLIWNSYEQLAISGEVGTGTPQGGAGLGLRLAHRFCW